jgi:alanyl-tRNA synthetase
VAAGVRRIEGVTGQAALDWVKNTDSALSNIASLLKAPLDKTVDKVAQLLEKNRLLEKELERLQAKLASSAGNALTAQAVDIEGIKVLAVRLDDIDPKAMRDMVDQLKNKLGSAAIVLANVKDGKISLIAGVSKDQTHRIKAGDLVNSVATKVGGKGGGRPDMAQAGGDDVSGLDAALQNVPAWVQAQLNS